MLHHLAKKRRMDDQEVAAEEETSTGAADSVSVPTRMHDSDDASTEELTPDYDQDPDAVVLNQKMPDFENTEEAQQCKERLICLIPHADLVKRLYQEWIGLTAQNQSDVKDRFKNDISDTRDPANTPTLLKAQRIAYCIIMAFECWTQTQDVEGACGVDEELAKLGYQDESEVYRAVVLLQQGIGRVTGNFHPIVPVPRSSGGEFVTGRQMLLEQHNRTAYIREHARLLAFASAQGRFLTGKPQPPIPMEEGECSTSLSPAPGVPTDGSGDNNVNLPRISMFNDAALNARIAAVLDAPIDNIMGIGSIPMKRKKKQFNRRRSPSSSSEGSTSSSSLNSLLGARGSGDEQFQVDDSSGACGHGSPNIPDVLD